MSIQIKNEPENFNTIEILDDDEIEKIGEEVNQLIDLLDDDEEDDSHTVERYPGLMPKSMKRDHGNNGTLFVINILIESNIFKLNYIFFPSKIFYD